MNQNGNPVPAESEPARLKEMRVKQARQQLELGRLEINSEKTARELAVREAAVAVEIRRAHPKMSIQELTAEVTDRLAKDDVFWHLTKYYERLRRRTVKLMYRKSLLAAEIEYLTKLK